MRPETVEQYAKALKAGQKYYRAAVARGGYPYLPVLDEFLDENSIAARMDLGVISIPMELVAGTKSAGRTTALAGNFMPLLPADSEFACKWMLLCDAHLSDTGITDPIYCFEYMGRFYVQEGNKRLSVMKSYGAALISAHVVRLVPEYSDEPAVQLYYEFMQFYALSGLYGIFFRHPGGYVRLQAALGMDKDQIWSQQDRRSFSAGYVRFEQALEKVNAEKLDITPAEAILIWLETFSFAEIKELPMPELTKKLNSIWPDIKAKIQEAIAVSTEPEEKDQSFLAKLLSMGHSYHIVGPSFPGGVYRGLYLVVQVLALVTLTEAVDVLPVLVLEVSGGGLGHGLRGGDAHIGHVHVPVGDHCPGVQHGLALSVQEVAAQVRIVCLIGHDIQEGIHAKVKFVVAGDGKIIAHLIHNVHDPAALGQGAQGGTLNSVAVIYQGYIADAVARLHLSLV